MYYGGNGGADEEQYIPRIDIVVAFVIVVVRVDVVWPVELRSMPR